MRTLALLTLGVVLCSGCAAGSDEGEGDTNLSVMQTGTDEAQTVNGGSADSPAVSDDRPDRDYLPESPVAVQPAPVVRDLQPR